MQTYQVFNHSDGMLYNGPKLNRAMRIAQQPDAFPHIYTVKNGQPYGRRPVVLYLLNDVEFVEVGEYGESYEQCRDRLARDLERYEGQAFVA